LQMDNNGRVIALNYKLQFLFLLLLTFFFFLD
jgi:hypothetical protein